MKKTKINVFKSTVVFGWVLLFLFFLSVRGFRSDVLCAFVFVAQLLLPILVLVLWYFSNRSFFGAQGEDPSSGYGLSCLGIFLNYLFSKSLSVSGDLPNPFNDTGGILIVMCSGMLFLGGIFFIIAKDRMAKRFLFISLIWSVPVGLGLSYGINQVFDRSEPKIVFAKVLKVRNCNKRINSCLVEFDNSGELLGRSYRINLDETECITEGKILKLYIKKGVLNSNWLQKVSSVQN